VLRGALFRSALVEAHEIIAIVSLAQDDLAAERTFDQHELKTLTRRQFNAQYMPELRVMLIDAAAAQDFGLAIDDQMQGDGPPMK